MLINALKATRSPVLWMANPCRFNSSTASKVKHEQPHPDEQNKAKQEVEDQAKKSTAQADEELRRKMAGISGDGGEAGVEYEDGQPVSMKRGVKNNMFRYI